jgi:hypothetical protein
VPTAPVDEVLATSATVASISTDMRGYRFPLAAPLTLTASSGCLVALGNAARAVNKRRTGTPPEFRLLC